MELEHEEVWILFKHLSLIVFRKHCMLVVLFLILLEILHILRITLLDGWNVTTQTWFVLGSGSGTNGLVLTLAFDSSKQILYVGGKFTTNGSGSLSLNYIGGYFISNQTWFPLGTNSSNGIVNNGFVFVDALTFDNSNKILYIGGQFSNVSGSFSSPVNNIVGYNTTTETFFTLGQGSNNGIIGRVLSIAFDSVSGVLFVGGAFAKTGNNIRVNNIAGFNTTNQTWFAFGTGSGVGVNAGGIFAIVYDSVSKSIIIGGRFSSTYNVDVCFGGGFVIIIFFFASFFFLVIIAYFYFFSFLQY